MKGKLLLAVIALVSLSGFGLADDKIVKEKVGTWVISGARSSTFSFVNAQTYSQMMRKGDATKVWSGFSLGCTAGKGENAGLFLNGDLDKFANQTVTYRFADGPELTSIWTNRSEHNLQALDFPGDVNAFVQSLPTSGKMKVRVELQDGPAETSYDLNGIDEVRHTLDDVCKLSPATSGQQ
jgi:hypothetical protein